MIDKGAGALAIKSVLAAGLVVGVIQPCLSQAPQEVVRWSAAVSGATALKRHGTATLKVSGDVLDGWHVYALRQKPGGPTALRVTLDDNATAWATGQPSGTSPEKTHDPSFDLDTWFYRQSFAIRLPIAIKARAEEGAQIVPVKLRFQSCNDHICLPPKTIDISVPVTVLPDT